MIRCSLGYVSSYVIFNNMHVKICGITSLDHARAAVQAGAQMIGFNFYPPSPRFISAQACAQIVRALRAQNMAVITVGVFVNMPPEQVMAIMEQCGLDRAQLSGDEPPEALKALGPMAFKAVRPATLAEALAALERYGQDTAPALLVDARTPHYGGSGRLADWRIARELAQRAPILLAGGLTPDNVGEAIRAVQPWGVDVASGVEARPGVKDPARMAAFIRNATGSGPGPEPR